jgi:hypothetical protein
VSHADGNAADGRPGIEPCAERPERAVVRGHRALSESDRPTEVLAALVEHGLFDYLVCPQPKRLQDSHSERFPRSVPIPPSLPPAACINKPATPSITEGVLHDRALTISHTDRLLRLDNLRGAPQRSASRPD